MIEVRALTKRYGNFTAVGLGPLTFNAAAEKLIRQGLTQAGAPSRFLIVPGEATATSAGKRTSRAPQGSIDAEARSNPLVQEAQTLFQAEIIAVVDLRT